MSHPEPSRTSASGGRMAIEPSQPTAAALADAPSIVVPSEGTFARTPDAPITADGDHMPDSLSSSTSSLDVRLGYPAEAFEQTVMNRPDDAVEVIVDGLWRHGHLIPTRVYLQSEMTLGRITDFLKYELGLHIELSRQGTVIDPDRTVLSFASYPTLKVTAVHGLRPLVAPDMGPHATPTEINALGLYFDVTGDSGSPHGVIVPCGATLKMVWERKFIDLGTKPRFLIDGERQSALALIKDLDLSEGVVIEVVAGQEGGGGDEPEGKVEDEASGEEHDSIAPSASHPTYFVAQPGPTVAATSPTSSRDTTAGATTSSAQNRPPVLHPVAPRFPTDLIFNGDRPEDFFKDFEHYCSQALIPRHKWLDHLPSRLSRDEAHDMRSFAEDLPEWDRGDYEGVKAELIAIFSKDRGFRYLVKDLEAYVAKNRDIKDLSDLNQYTIGFKTMGNYLIKKKLLNDAECRDLYLKGMPDDLLNRLERLDSEPRHPRGPLTLRQVPRTF